MEQKSHQNSSTEIDVQGLQLRLVPAKLEDSLLSDSGAVCDVESPQLKARNCCQTFQGVGVDGATFETQRSDLRRFFGDDVDDASKRQPVVVDERY